MKIALRGGHNYYAVGSKGLIDEVDEDRKVYKAVMKYLIMDGQEVLDVTPGNMDSKSDLRYGVTKANEWGADLFISIHFNKVFGSYKESLGTEVWINPKNHKAREIAERITKNLKHLGFRDRGVKDGLSRGFYEIKYINMAAIIVEVCFVESEKDVEIYMIVGPDKVGKAIADGIVGHKISENEEEISTTNIYGIAKDFVDVRQGPGMEYKAIGELEKGTKVKISGDENGQWYNIYFGDHGGYVPKKYIESQ